MFLTDVDDVDDVAYLAYLRRLVNFVTYLLTYPSYWRRFFLVFFLVDSVGADNYSLLQPRT